jgi:hypothetical protein
VWGVIEGCSGSVTFWRKTIAGVAVAPLVTNVCDVVFFVPVCSVAAAILKSHVPVSAPPRVCERLLRDLS